jgi:hypothetical protein
MAAWIALFKVMIASNMEKYTLFWVFVFFYMA